MDRKLIAGRIRMPLLLAIALSTPLQLAAQVPVDESGEPLTAYDDGAYTDGRVAGAKVEDILSLTEVDLEDLVGPVALYPDDLLAIVLPASTYPLEIVQAARFLDEFEIDSSLEPDESWDESVVALLNYPEVIRMMDEQIDWTWRLGEAVISQQADVIAAVEAFRDRAYAAGNLETDEYQTVSNDNGVIEIDPADDEIIYVPYYEPAEVVVYQSETVYDYYPQPYPVYYYPYPAGHRFSSGHFWGVTTAFTIGWPNRYLHVHHPSYWGHPYYGSSYYGHYYRQPSISVYNSWYGHNSYYRSNYLHRDGDVWRPRNRSSGARPENRSARNRHYPPGNDDMSRNNSQSDRRSTLDTQAANRVRDTRNRAASFSDNSAQQNNSDRIRVNSIAAARDRREIRFRDRSGADTLQADRQRPTAQSSQVTTSVAPANRSRPANGRTARATRPATAVTSSRSVSNRRPVAQRQASSTTVRRAAPTQRTVARPTAQQQATTRRQASRPVVQRQATTQRQAARPASQRQAPAQRSTPAATQLRQSSPRRPTSANRGGQAGVKPPGKQSSNRGSSSRQRRPQ